MSLSCSVNAITPPQLFGGEILAVDANLVQNFSSTAHSLLYYGHPTVKLEGIDFCNVTVTYTHPGQNDTIHVETWLPIKNYNGRLHSVGGGGWIAGRYPPSYVAMQGAIGEGYVASSTDAGLLMQDDFQPDAWALTSDGNPNIISLNNFGAVSLRDQAIISKSVIESFYGEPPKYSYWSGCSQGGRQGMMLAQRYPDAYDGIHACAPAIYSTQLFSSTFWPQLLMSTMNYYPRPCELSYITAEAVKYCDGKDGIIDGIISDGDTCDFDTFSVVGKVFNCSDTGVDMVVSQNAAVVAKATWSGPETTDGKSMWYGPNIGSQITGSTTGMTNDIGLAMTSCSSNNTCVGVPVGLGEVLFKYFIEADPDWSYDNMTRKEYERYFHAASQRYDSIIGTSDPDLTAFYEKGGKILGYHGMSDQIIPVKATEQYLGEVREVIPNVDSFYRIFEVPGLLHCSGGSGGQPNNTFDALRAWVEDGTVPESLAHSYTDTDGNEQNRLLCPYPKKARLRSGNNGAAAYQSTDFECI